MAVNQQRGNRTFLASVLLSAPGPLVLGLGLLVGRSSTQIADFVRRTIELAATAFAWYVFQTVANLAADDKKRLRLEALVNLGIGLAMVISGLAMAVLTITGFLNESAKGNVIPALVIACLGVISNGILALNYSLANRKSPSSILKAQTTLYGTKTFVDSCVCIALVIVWLVTGLAARIADLAGGLVVTIVLTVNGSLLLNKKPVDHAP